MHELSLAQSLIEQITEAVAAEGDSYSRIEQIYLELGAMSGVDRDAFEFVFPFAAEKTLAEGAALFFDEVPVQVRCNVCREVSSPPYPHVVCEACGATRVDVIAGKDFKITKMEVS